MLVSLARLTDSHSFGSGVKDQVAPCTSCVSTTDFEVSLVSTVSVTDNTDDARLQAELAATRGLDVNVFRFGDRIVFLSNSCALSTRNSNTDSGR